MFIEVNNADAIEVNGTYFENRILMPSVTGGYVPDCDVEKLCMNIFHKVNGVPKGSFNPVSTKKHIKKTRRIFKEELFRVCDATLEPDQSDAITDTVLNEAFPADKAFKKAPDKIHTEAVSTHITRVLMQTVFDQLRPGNTTHMSVEHPLKITEHKWDEVRTDELIQQDIEYFVEPTQALILNGWFLDVPVYLPAVDNKILTHNDCKTVAESIFNRVTDRYNMNKENQFTSIGTKELANQLNLLITEELIEQAEPLDENPKGSEEEWISSHVHDAFPRMEAYAAYPDAVYCKNAVMHITRMVVQTVFDTLRNNETHMSVTDPLNITEHKWDEITIK